MRSARRLHGTAKTRDRRPDAVEETSLRRLNGYLAPWVPSPPGEHAPRTA